MKRITIIVILAAFSLVAVAAIGARSFVPRVGPESTFVIAPGESARAVSDRLAEEGVVSSAALFRLTLARTGTAARLQPGEHDISGARSLADLARTFTSGSARAAETTIRVLEGWDLIQIAEHLTSLGLPGAEELFAVTGVPASAGPSFPATASVDFSDRFAFLASKPTSASLEGYLFPDTYRVFPDASAEDIVLMMLANFDRRVSLELRERIAASGRTLHEVVTMASIVEREVRGERDRRMVADLFWRRLRIGMALQADSTVNYITRKGMPSVSFADTEIDSRYNTYRYPGLPPGPIGNPGLSAIAATADPLPNPYLFFLTDPVGNVHYGRTFDEHIANRQYLR